MRQRSFIMGAALVLFHSSLPGCGLFGPSEPDVLRPAILPFDYANALFVGDTVTLRLALLGDCDTVVVESVSDAEWLTTDSSIFAFDVSRDRWRALKEGVFTLHVRGQRNGETFTDSVRLSVFPRPGGKIAFVRALFPSPVKLAVLNVSTGSVRDGPEFGVDREPHGNPSIDSQGRFVAVQAITFPGLRSDVFLIGLLTAINLTQSLGVHEILPAISPDGEYVAYVSPGPLGWEVWVQSRAGGIRQRITNVGLPYPMDVTFLPGGDSLVFEAEMPFDPEKAPELFVVSREGGEVVQVTDMPTTAKLKVAASPDGRYLAFQSLEGEPPNYAGQSLQIFDRVSKSARELVPVIVTTPGGGCGQLLSLAEDPSFSPDGSWLVFTWVFPTTRGVSLNLYALHIATGKLVQLTRGRNLNVQPDWR